MNQMLKENKNKQAPSQPWDIARLIEYWDSMSKALGLVYSYKLGVAIHASNPRACQMEAERPGVQAHPKPHSKFKSRYVNPCLK